MNRGQQLTLFGGLGLVIGALLPWAKIASPLLGMTVNKSGYEGDGLFTGGLGLLLFISAMVSKGKPGKTYSIVGALLSIIAGIALIVDLTGVNTAVADIGEGIIASVGIGIYVSIIGAILAIIGGLQKITSAPIVEQITQST
jgi:hypothetical protein